MTSLIVRSRLALRLMLAITVASGAQAQARDTIVIVSVSPSGNLRYGTPTEFVLVADVTLASLDTGAVVVGFNLDDPRKYRMMPSAGIHRGTQRVTLRATVAPVDWSAQGARFGYIVNIRSFELPGADGRSRGIATVRREFGAVREVGTVLPAAPEPTYFEFQVEKPVRQAPGSAAPRFPIELRKAGVEGEVLAQFVVDTLGAPVLESFKVLKASAPEFAEAVKAALPGMKFQAAEVRGRKVRQLVQQPFVFAISTGENAAPKESVLRAGLQPVLPPATITPTPRAGVVRGWMIARRLTVDSGNGATVVSTVNRRFGTAGHTRFEVEPPARFALGPMVSLTDSATRRTTMIMPSQKMATITHTPTRNDAPLSGAFRPSPRGVIELGAGDTIATLPTKHYRVTGTMESRLDLGERACVVTQETSMEVWASKDPTLVRIERQLRGSGPERLAPSSIPATAADADGLAALGALLRVVTHNAGSLKGAVTTTSEVTSYSEGTLEASLFEPPEGYQLRDMTTVAPSARSDSLRIVAAKRFFERLVDTTKVVPGVTTTCTAVKK